MPIPQGEGEDKKQGEGEDKKGEGEDKKQGEGDDVKIEEEKKPKKPKTKTERVEEWVNEHVNENKPIWMRNKIDITRDE